MMLLRTRAKSLAITTGVCCAFFVTLVPSAFAETWKSLAPLPVPTEGLSAARVGPVIVGAYGFTSSGDSNLTRLYHIEANTWSAGAPAPGIASSEGIGVSERGRFYALGGRNGAGHDNNRYTLATNTWEELAPMPTGRDGLGAAKLEKYVYAVGGRSETAGPCTGGAGLATVERYKVDSNTWEAVAPLPTSRSDVGVMAYAGKLYVFGGCNLTGVTGEVDIYNPKTNTWSAGAPMPTPRAAFYSIGIGGGINTGVIYVIGGVESFVVTSSANEAYNTATNSWTKGLPMPHPRAEMGVASAEDKIFTLGGGIPGFGSPQATNEVFEP
jgi:N-acetylneuraminic acid mutarotase